MFKRKAYYLVTYLVLNPLGAGNEIFEVTSWDFRKPYILIKDARKTIAKHLNKCEHFDRNDYTENDVVISNIVETGIQNYKCEKDNGTHERRVDPKAPQEELMEMFYDMSEKERKEVIDFAIKFSHGKGSRPRKIEPSKHFHDFS